MVVSFNADFLGDFNGASLETSYAAARVPGDKMLRHVQIESNMSLTGANADTRIKQKPSQLYKTLVEVYNGLNGVLLIRLLLLSLKNFRLKEAML